MLGNALNSVTLLSVSLKSQKQENPVLITAPILYLFPEGLPQLFRKCDGCCGQSQQCLIKRNKKLCHTARCAVPHQPLLFHPPARPPAASPHITHSCLDWCGQGWIVTSFNCPTLDGDRRVCSQGPVSVSCGNGQIKEGTAVVAKQGGKEAVQQEVTSQGHHGTWGSSGVSCVAQG